MALESPIAPSDTGGGVLGGGRGGRGGGGMDGGFLLYHRITGRSSFRDVWSGCIFCGVTPARP